MKILIVGGGGREHALAWKLAQSPLTEKLYCAPGNAGIAAVAECVGIAADDVARLTAFALDNAIDLVVIGPEAPLVAGLADALREKGIKAFGPSAQAARLEGSKGFMKDLCHKYGIPTAAYGRFTAYEEAEKFIAASSLPVVVKADGLAAGKGVIIAQSHDEARTAARDMLSGEAFGAAGRSIVVEEYLDGEEISFFALADGRDFTAFGSARDHKRAFDGDKGPNTGGMGVISPAPAMSFALQKKIEDRIIRPAIEGMAKEGCPFTGVLFAGIMVVKDEPVLLEFNTRFGDPECQALMLRFDGDLARLLAACAGGSLSEAALQVKWRDDIAICVVMAAQGYPGAVVKGSVIGGLDKAAAHDGIIFHAATRRDDQNRLVSDGGRVLTAAALGADSAAARRKAYEAAAAIDWPEGFYRRDIGA